MSLKVADLLQIVPDIDGQIYARDFMLVRQSDMIVSYIPELPGPAGTIGKPGLSSGVERELQHAHEHAKDVYVIWKPKRNPAPSSPKPPTKSSAPSTKPSNTSTKKATSNRTHSSAPEGSPLAKKHIRRLAGPRRLDRRRRTPSPLVIAQLGPTHRCTPAWK